MKAAGVSTDRRGRPQGRSAGSARDADGRLLGRFDIQGGAKEIPPLVFAEHKKFGRQAAGLVSRSRGRCTASIAWRRAQKRQC